MNDSGTAARQHGRVFARQEGHRAALLQHDTYGDIIEYTMFGRMRIVSIANAEWARQILGKVCYVIIQLLCCIINGNSEDHQCFHASVAIHTMITMITIIVPLNHE